MGQDRGVKRYPVVVLALLLALTGCAQLWGTGDWDRIVVTVTGGTGATTR